MAAVATATMVMASVSLVVTGTVASASTTAIFSASRTLSAPPASSAGSAGGDGWALAVSATKVFNVFHHDSSALVVACHKQSDGSECWSPYTVTDGSGNNFSGSSHPGMYLDQATGQLLVYTTRTSDSTAGVVCFDTTVADPATTNPFCGFTALTDVGSGGITSQPSLVNGQWFAFNYVSGAGTGAGKNEMLCVDVATKAACSGQPYVLPFSSTTFSTSTFPVPMTASIGDDVIVPEVGDAGSELTCFDPSTKTTCSGSWPIAAPSAYVSGNGAPFPPLSAAGALTGFCLPTGVDPCYTMGGVQTTTPPGMPGVVTGTSPWNGPAMVFGPRVYLADGNTDTIRCYDASTDASCPNYPKVLVQSGYTYTVNPDPNRPTCIWTVADNGSAQIQNFDAYTAGACGQSPYRVLASGFVVSSSLCQPSAFQSLQVTDPAPTAYTNGSVSFQDADGQPISGASARTLDSTGTADLTGLNLSNPYGPPQFLIDLQGAVGTNGLVTVKLTWTGTNDPSCAQTGTTVTVPPTPTPPAPPVTPPPVTTTPAGTVTASTGRLVITTGGSFTATCRYNLGPVKTCAVSAVGPTGTVLATGTPVTVAAGAPAVSERLVLNAAGIKAAGAAGGVTVTLRATITPLSGAAVTARTTLVVVKKTTSRSLLGGVLFSSNSAVLSSAGKSVLVKIAKQVAGSKQLECDGFTASTGNPTGEYKFGLKRAAVVCTFIKAEIKLLKLKPILKYVVKSYGATKPVSRTKQALNRRVSLIVFN